MDLDFFKRFFDLLLFKSSNFGLVISRFFSQFFEGLSILPQIIRDHLAGIFADLIPSKTNRLKQWSLQFGKPFILTKDALQSEWENRGGQSPAYLQNILQAAGFDVYVHEWWDFPITTPLTPRFPELFFNSYEVLVNDIKLGAKNYNYQCKPVSSSSLAQCKLESSPTSESVGSWNGVTYTQKQYELTGLDGEELLDNGSFESSITVGWTIVQQNATRDLIESPPVDSGSYSLKLVDQGSGGG